MDQLTTMNDLFISEIHRRLFEENFPRLRKCLLQLSDKEIWSKPNLHSNSVGNLALHLCGNIRQWIGSGLGKNQDERVRDLEFSEKGPIPKDELLALINKVENEARDILADCSIDDLLKIHDVQIYRESGISILIHVVEHFSYHVGQITYFIKYKKDMDMGYYQGL